MYNGHLLVLGGARAFIGPMLFQNRLWFSLFSLIVSWATLENLVDENQAI